MKIKNLILPLILASSLIGCKTTTVREYTVVKIKSLPKEAKLKAKYKDAQVNLTPGKLKPREVEIFGVGPTLDEEGNMVGPHVYYRVVETQRFVFTQHHTDSFPASKKTVEPSKQDVVDAVKEAKNAAAQAQSAITQIRNMTTPQAQAGQYNQADPNMIGNNTTSEPVNDIKNQIEQALSPKTDQQQALQQFDKETQP